MYLVLVKRGGGGDDYAWYDLYHRYYVQVLYVYIYTCGLYLFLSLYVILHSRISRMENSPNIETGAKFSSNSCCTIASSLVATQPSPSTNSDFAAPSPSAPPNRNRAPGPSGFQRLGTNWAISAIEHQDLTDQEAPPRASGWCTSLPPTKKVREGTEKMMEWKICLSICRVILIVRKNGGHLVYHQYRIYMRNVVPTKHNKNSDLNSWPHTSKSIV